MSLPWFQKPHLPIYLAPMAGVTDSIFRTYCKAYGADVVVTEFVSAEGIFRKNERTLEYLEFTDAERPVGIQLFGGDPDHLGEAARMVLEWKQPDFLDINFGCPVNKVVSRNGGSALLRDCPLLERVASAIVRAASPVPVTAKIRIGWCQDSINAVTTARILEGVGISAVAVHGRTKEQGYGGEANWDVIAEVAGSVKIPVIGNGDLTSGADLLKRRNTGVAGFMIGRAAMGAPWIFREMSQTLAGQPVSPAPSLRAQWNHIRSHCVAVMEREGSEFHALSSMRSRLMTYTKGMPDAKMLRQQFSHVSTIMQLEEIAAAHLARNEASESAGMVLAA